MSASVNAPEIDLPGLEWFNVPAPLSLNALHGRVVVLDFWTFCCINCMHIIPTLKEIEEAFPEDVVVIGVHSPKFKAERENANVREAIKRYGIVHPVVHDPDFELWKQYAVRAWPTLVIVSPDGKVIGQIAGEPDPRQFRKTIGAIIATYRSEGVLVPRELALTPESRAGGRFLYPGKIKPVPGSEKRWVLADAGHHQIVLLDDAGRELRRFGSGRPGFDDGASGLARFNSPQGLIAGESAIFVADTGNHAIRRIDLDSGTVRTLAGGGHRGLRLDGPEPAGGAALASPWDLEISGDQLYFANAGTHQLGVLDLATNTVAALGGSGREDIVDGPAEEAALAQPSGLALDAAGQTLFFADSETSAIRALSLGGQRRVRTLVGRGLFDFGHQNGAFGEARLQHPLGVAVADGNLLVADSYNGAIRRLDLSLREVSDFENGFECRDQVCLPAGEPAGIWADGADRVFLVDTNNHRILEYRSPDRSYSTWAA